MVIISRSNYALEPIEIVQKMLLEGENWNDDDICYEIAAIRDNAPDDPCADTLRHLR